ncbi:MAG: methyltransferase domain-containing protein, partial [Planctomycetota bacterium]
DMGRSLSRSATYRRYLPAPDDPSVNYIAVDLIAKQKPDVRADFEATLPFADGSIDRVMLLNVLEHIYEHRKLLSELRRVLKPGGKMYFYVPFFIVIHRHPHDFYRYTDEALERMMNEAGFANADIIAHGGFFHTVGTFWDWLCRAPLPFRWLSFLTTFNTVLWDGLIEVLSKGKVRERFVLGYFVEATA